MPVKSSLRLERYLHLHHLHHPHRRPAVGHCVNVPCSVSAGAGLLLCLQLLQPGDGEDGRDGAADGGSGPAHQRPADPAG